MNNFVILIPSYNDWDNLNVLIPKIHNILKNKVTKNVVARDGIEPPTQAFSGLCSTD